MKKKSASTSSTKKMRTFSAYQKMVEQTDERRSRTISLLGLVGEVGDLHSMIKKLLVQRENPTFREDLRQELGDLLWYLTSLSSLFKVPLQEVAEANAKKARLFYSPGKLSRFDRGYSKDERFPRKFSVRFAEKRNKTGGAEVKISVNEVQVGNVLTDNAREDDGYRFHDAFHLAYAAVLGWSPNVRKLLSCKRKSDPKVDEVEDGARAAIIEEAVSILIFNQAAERGWYAEPSSVDMGLLKTIQRTVGKLEVRVCTAKQWRNAVCQGYLVFRELKKNSGGEVVVDLDGQKVSYKKVPGAIATKLKKARRRFA